MDEIILASKSRVREKILKENGFLIRVIPSNVDEEIIKESLIREGASPELISKNLAEIKANKISQKFPEKKVLGAESVINLEGEIISKPSNRTEALKILTRLNGKKHQLISSVCISSNGRMIWNFSDKAFLTMKSFDKEQLNDYLLKIPDEILYAYNVYQIEGVGKSLFSKIEGDVETIMGLPVKKIKEYIESLK